MKRGEISGRVVGGTRGRLVGKVRDIIKGK